MSGTDRVNAQSLFLWVGEFRTVEHWFKMREERFNGNLRSNNFTECGT